MLKQKAVRRIDDDCPDYLAGPAPFQNSCSIYQFYAGADRGLVLDSLIDDLQESDQNLRLMGEPGSGKTMLSLVLTHRLKSKFNIVRYDHDQASAKQLIQHLLIEFCQLQTRQLIAQLSAIEPGEEKKQVPHSGQELQDLERAVIESGSIKPIVLIIDSPKIQESSWSLLNRLTRLRANGACVFKTLVLVTPAHSPGIRSSNASSLEDFRQKDSRSGDVVYQLRRLTLSEIHDYLQHHMLLFDFNRRQMFGREMAYFIADRTEGLIKEVNTLARNACTLAGMQNDSNVTMSHLLSAGLPPEPEIKQSRTLRAIKAGGFRSAMLVASVMVMVATIWLTQA